MDNREELIKRIESLTDEEFEEFLTRLKAALCVVEASA